LSCQYTICHNREQPQELLKIKAKILQKVAYKDVNQFCQRKSFGFHLSALSIHSLESSDPEQQQGTNKGNDKH